MPVELSSSRTVIVVNGEAPEEGKSSVQHILDLIEDGAEITCGDTVAAKTVAYTDEPVLVKKLKLDSQDKEDSQDSRSKLFAFSTVMFIIIIICLSIALAATSGGKITKTKVITQIEFPTTNPPSGENICDGAKVALPNIDCVESALAAVESDRYYLGTAEQSGVNVTKGYQGDLDVETVPITNSYWEEGMCPVNVHWHLGTEHLSRGQYDAHGSGPSDDDDHSASAGDGEYNSRRLSAGGDIRAGYQCHHYDENDPKFTQEYDWQYCVDMHVGETYEVHWPHSNMGACGTPNQFQTNFYDGVFCTFATTFEGSLATAKIGVQGQIFTIVNDEDYYYPDLMHGAIVDGEKWSDVAKYTGSTTGTTRDNDVCSQYTGITWQVDRQCHMISASSFDKMCADMKSQRDDMSGDFYPHGARELVDDKLAADNHHKR